MTGGPAATVLVPTTGDRGPLLPYSVGSVLAQTVEDLEVFVVGDGVDDATREAAHDLCRHDERVRFFDHPKDVRRGEHHRHRLLREEARGRIVTYLCDRDLYLPHHVEVLLDVLADADWGHTFRFNVGPGGDLVVNRAADFTTVPDRRRALGMRTVCPLSFAGHTLDAYRRLPHGWRTTPPGIATDVYMWHQFLAQPWCRVATSTVPTVLYFRRGDHPGWSTERRLEILQEWAPRLDDPTLVRRLTDGTRETLIRRHAVMSRQIDRLEARLDRGRRRRQRLANKARRLVRNRWRRPARPAGGSPGPAPTPPKA